MPVKLDALIQKTQAALAAETDPRKRADLAARLAQQSAVAAECDDEDEDEEDDEEESRKGEKKRAEEEARAAGGKVGAARTKQAEEKKEEDEEEEEEEEESAKALLALVQQRTGKRGAAAVGAMAAVFSRLESVEADTAALKARQASDEKAQLIAKAAKYVPASQLAWLETQGLKTVRGFVEQACKGSPIVATEEGHLLIPKSVTPGTEESLTKDQLAQVESAMAACPSGYDRAKFRADLVAGVLKASAHNLNGASQRY